MSCFPCFPLSFFLFLFPQIRNKLNQDQNLKLQQQKELLNKRNMEVTLMDKRIGELRERLYKKKAEARQKEKLPVRRNTPTIHPSTPPSSPLPHPQWRKPLLLPTTGSWSAHC